MGAIAKSYTVQAVVELICQLAGVKPKNVVRLPDQGVSVRLARGKAFMWQEKQAQGEVPISVIGSL